MTKRRDVPAGQIGSHAASRAHPDRFEKLVLASTLACFAEEQTAAMEAGIHAKADDLKSDPSGNAGDRIACGVISK
jgi:Cu/Zn superoxide dismutase